MAFIDHHMVFVEGQDSRVKHGPVLQEPLTIHRTNTDPTGVLNVQEGNP